MILDFSSLPSLFWWPFLSSSQYELQNYTSDDMRTHPTFSQQFEWKNNCSIFQFHWNHSKIYINMHVLHVDEFYMICCIFFVPKHGWAAFLKHWFLLIFPCLLQVIYILYLHIICVYKCTCTHPAVVLLFQISCQEFSKRSQQKVATLQDTTNITINGTITCLTWVTCWHAWRAKYHLWTGGLPWREQAEETERNVTQTPLTKEDVDGESVQWLYLETQIDRSLFPGMRCPKVCRISVLVTENLSQWYFNMIHNNWIWEKMSFSCASPNTNVYKLQEVSHASNKLVLILVSQYRI